MAILLHGELGCPLSYLVSEVMAVEVSVTDMYGVAIVEVVFSAPVRKISSGDIEYLLLFSYDLEFYV